MSSLRAKFALILVTAIICVVGLATGMTIVVLTLNHTSRMPELVARQLIVVRSLARNPASEGLGMLSSLPATGTTDDSMQARLRDELAKRGAPMPVFVTRADTQDNPIASLELEPGRWLNFPMLEKPPREGWWILSCYMVLVIAGTTAVAIVAASRVTRPLILLETAALAAANSDGSLSPLPETGPVEIRTTARAINRISHSLRHAMEGRMRLVAAAGHDLRTPMTRMRLRVEFLPDAERGAWLRDLDELERIADSAIRLVRESTDSGPREVVALDALVGQVARELSDLRLDIAVARSDPAVISASPLALTRALRNLMINAATHGRGGVVSVTRGTDVVVLDIEDQGPGIPAEVLGQVFEPFFRVDPARRQGVPGAGLGLAIAREIVVRHRGTIELANRPGGGLSQRVTFALAG